MSDSGAPYEQKNELQRAVLGGAAAQGAMAALLHKDEEQKQNKDVQDQQLAAQAGAKATETRHAYNNDPIRKAGPGRTMQSQHAQAGSHGLSGQAPK